MSNSDTAPSNINPDPTKWRDRIAEFGASAIVVYLAAAASSFFALVLTATGFASASVMVPAFAVSASVTFITAGAAVAASVTGASKPERPRVLARTMGFVLPTLAGMAAGGLTATAPQPSADPVSAAPDVVFNVAAKDCKSERIKATIEKIKAEGFPVTCAKPAP